MTKIEFKEWPKTARHFRDIIVTEKIDGTNAAIQIIKSDDLAHWKHMDGSRTFFDPQPIDGVMYQGEHYVVYAQSRSRLIFPGTDNFGFAAWVAEHSAELVELLGPGTYYGEWWGKGIQRGYGQTEKRFSLFNTSMADKITYNRPEGLNISTVPVLYEGINDTNEIRTALAWLRTLGSVAAPGFLNPEGVCIYHTTLRTVSKVTLDKNDAGKWEAAA